MLPFCFALRGKPQLLEKHFASCHVYQAFHRVDYTPLHFPILYFSCNRFLAVTIDFSFSIEQRPDLVAHIASLDMTGLCEKELVSLGIFGMRQLAHAQAFELESAGIGMMAARSLLAVS